MKFHLASLLVVLLAGAGFSANAQVPLPQGLTCGLSYWGALSYVPNSCMGTATLPSTIPGFLPSVANYTNHSDGDNGESAGFGFYHQEMTNGIIPPSTVPGSPSSTDMFALPAGTMCGFHHTGNTPGLMCMGYQPSKHFGLAENMTGTVPGTAGCPAGWLARKVLDIDSDTRYWTWCEYQDPHNQAVSGAALPASTSGIACGGSSTRLADDPTGSNAGLNGACEGYDTLHGLSGATYCPGMNNSVYDDRGDGGGFGLGWCTITTTTIPTLASPPIARQPQDPPPPPPDCTETGCTGGKVCCTCTVTACESASLCNTQCHE